MSDSDFVTVEGRAEGLDRRDAVFLARPNQPGHWIPRALLHHEDRTALASLMEGASAKLRIRKWKADQLGLSGETDNKTGDLFEGRPIL